MVNAEIGTASLVRPNVHVRDAEEIRAEQILPVSNMLDRYLVVCTRIARSVFVFTNIALCW
jgi:hypothetical protein